MRRPVPDYEEFSRLLQEMVESVPPEFLRGLSGVFAVREEKRDRSLVDVFLLGEYHERADGKYVYLYYGSFLAMGWRDARKFEREMRDTLLHELEHHWEEAAGLPDLREEDERRLEGFRRRGGPRRRRRRVAADPTWLVARAVGYVLAVLAAVMALGFVLERLGK